MRRCRARAGGAGAGCSARAAAGDRGRRLPRGPAARPAAPPTPDAFRADRAGNGSRPPSARAALGVEKRRAIDRARDAFGDETKQTELVGREDVPALAGEIQQTDELALGVKR